MKKLILFTTLFIILLTGCALNNNPLSKVEEYLGKYQRLEDDIIINYNAFLGIDDADDSIRDRYIELIKKQYRNLSYEIKNEEIDGNNAVITTEIEVIDYISVIDEYSSYNYSESDYHNLVLDDLENTSDKITYTIDFYVTKKDDEWVLEELDEDSLLKLMGMF